MDFARLFCTRNINNKNKPEAKVSNVSFQDKTMIINMMPAFTAVMAMQKKSELAKEYSVNTKITPHVLKQELCLSDVGFAYHTNKPTLQHIHLTIKPNQTIAIVGRSGAGKSTLADVLIGLLMIFI